MELPYFSGDFGVYKILLDGVTVETTEDPMDAAQRALHYKLLNPTAFVELIGPYDVEVLMDTIDDPEPEPEEPEPEEPEPEEPEPEEPEPEEPEPEDPEDPEDIDPDPGEPPPIPEPVEYDGEHPFYAVAATMQPGEFKRVTVALPEGIENMARMNNTNWFSGGSGTFGVGWTDRMMFDEKNTGRIYNVLLREQFPTSVTWLEPTLEMKGVPVGEEAGLTRRRPFNRLCLVDDYLYFSPSQPSTEIGRMTRCHVTTPHIWEDAGAPRVNTTSLSGSMSAGEYSMSWHEDIQKFVLLTAGSGRGDKSDEGVHTYEAGRVWVWGFGDPEWVQIGRVQSCGYASSAIYNHVRQEVLLYGGSTAYSNPHPLGGQCTATVDKNGVLTRHGPSGLFVSAGNRRVTYHPITGDYIVHDQESINGARISNRIWIGDPPRGKPWRLMHKIGISKIFDAYEVWHRCCILPRTDTIIWADHRRGYILHKPLRWEDLTEADNIENVQPGMPENAVTPPYSTVHWSDVLGNTEEPDPVDPGPDPETPVEPDPVEPDPVEPDPEVPDLPEVPEATPKYDGEMPNMGATAMHVVAETCATGRTVKLASTYPEYSPEWTSFRDHSQTEGGTKGDMQTWGAKAHWDRLRQRAFFLGDRTAKNQTEKMVFHSYFAEDDRWEHLPLEMDITPRISQPHTYGEQTLDDRRGLYYYNPGPDRINRYIIDEQRWETIPLAAGNVSFGNSGLVMHEGLDMLLVSHRGMKNTDESPLYCWRDGMTSWEVLSISGHDSYHAHFRYNRKRGDALMLGGNNNPTRVTIVDKDGKCHRMADRPNLIVGDVSLAFGVGDRHLTYDPKSGNYLLFDRNRVVWEYNPDTDQWAVGRSWAAGTENSSDWSGPYHGNLGIPVDGTDYMLWYSYYTPRIYKHQAVLV